MNRIEVNDLFMSAYITALDTTGYHEQAEKVKEEYERQRAEIIANSKEV